MVRLRRRSAGAATFGVRRRLVAPACLAGLLGGALPACAPVLNWRQMRPEGWALEAAMPCRPDRLSRDLPLAGTTVTLTLLVCRVGEHSFALASAVLPDPGSVPAVLQALVAAARDNVAGQVEAERPLRVPGMTPQPSALHRRLHGQAPDGRAVTEEVAVFAHGMRVFQATVLGPALDTAQTAPFFDGLKVVS